MKMEAEVGGTELEAKKLAYTQLGRRKGPCKAAEGTRPCRHLDPGSLTPANCRECSPAVPCFLLVGLLAITGGEPSRVAWPEPILPTQLLGVIPEDMMWQKSQKSLHAFHLPSVMSSPPLHRLLQTGPCLHEGSVSHILRCCLASSYFLFPPFYTRLFN